MQLDLRKVTDEGVLRLELNSQLLAEWCADSPLSAKAGQVELAHQRDGLRVRITGSVTAALQGTCALCGGEASGDHVAQIAATFLRNEDTTPHQDDLKDDDGLHGCQLEAEAMEEECFEGEVIDLSAWLRDEWRLGLPLALRCPDGLCREAAASSQELPVDPRWAGLAVIRDSLPGGE
jgi:uncharacterized metal-binding protein YceD (DUF177 family)